MLKHRQAPQCPRVVHVDGSLHVTYIFPTGRRHASSRAVNNRVVVMPPALRPDDGGKLRELSSRIAASRIRSIRSLKANADSISDPQLAGTFDSIKLDPTASGRLDFTSPKFRDIPEPGHAAVKQESLSNPLRDAIENSSIPMYSRANKSIHLGPAPMILETQPPIDVRESQSLADSLANSEQKISRPQLTARASSRAPPLRAPPSRAPSTIHDLPRQVASTTSLSTTSLSTTNPSKSILTSIPSPNSEKARKMPVEAPDSQPSVKGPNETLHGNRSQETRSLQIPETDEVKPDISGSTRAAPSQNDTAALRSVGRVMCAFIMILALALLVQLGIGMLCDWHTEARMSARHFSHDGDMRPWMKSYNRLITRDLAQITIAAAPTTRTFHS